MANMPVIVNLSSCQYMFSIPAVRALLRKWTPWVQKEDESLLFTGEKGVLSAEMGRDLRELAQIAIRNPEVCAGFSTGNLEDVLNRLNSLPDSAGFLEKFQNFLNRYGHRGIKEIELRSPRWREDPIPVLGMIRNYVLAQDTGAKQDTQAEKKRDALLDRIQNDLKKLPFERVFPWRNLLIRWLCSHVRYYSKLRENSRFYHIMAADEGRKKILHIEKDLLEHGLLRCREDIFFLTLDEVRRLQKRKWGWRDVEDRVRERRLEHERLSKRIPPRTIGIETDDSESGLLKEETETHCLKGQAGSPGICEGIARVILDPAIDAGLKPGEILIAPYTDPAWTPLFLTAAGAVVEVGSYLSHAGTVAREYGMPCVVDVAGCTTRIPTGTRIRVDGYRGRVYFLS
jgi:pyruvate,water dikinase